MITRRSFLGIGTAALALAAVPANSVFAATTASWGQLSQNIQGTLVLPSDAAYATAKQLDLMQYDVVNPQAIAYCVNPTDVATCLKFAQDNGVPFAVRSGGHSTGGYSTTQGLVIDVSSLNAVTAANGTVSIGAGAQLVDITNSLAPSGLAISGGMCPTVAAGGYLQGGGIGMLTRSIGIASDTVVSAEVVLADGSLVTASAEQNCDLYWAIRGGGGGNFGVVTSYSVTPSNVSQLPIGNLAYNYDDATDMLNGWAQWLVDAPWTIGSAVTVSLDDAAVGNTPTAAVLLVSVGTAAELASEMNRLISMTAAPTSQQTDIVAYQPLMMGFYGCATDTVAQCHRIGSSAAGVLPRPAFGMERSRLFSAPMPRSGWAQALAVFDLDRVAGVTHQLRGIGLGGAANALSRTATAYVHRDSQYLVDFVGSVFTPPATSEQTASAQDWTGKGFAAVDPYSNGESYQNFVDPALTDWQAAYYAENYSQLVSIKNKYDPSGAFTFAQSIG